MSSHLGQEIIDKLLQRLQLNDATESKIQLSGLHGSARAFLIARVLASSDRRIAVICPEAADAARMHQDIRNFLLLLGKQDLSQSIEFLPGWEHSPYRAFNPSIKNRIRRLRALHRVRAGEARALITDTAAFSQRIPLGRELEDRSFTLRISDVIDREKLSQKLEMAGYTWHDPVEDPGTYAIRGSLVDIFSSSMRRPMRLDFFDDVIETIRTYDPLTQRSDADPLPEATIIPVAEWAMTPENIARAKTLVKNLCDEFGIPKQARDEFADKLDAGIRDPSLEYLAPFFTGDGGTWIPEVLSDDWIFSTSDSLGIEAAYDDLIAELKEAFQKTLEEGRIAAPWQQLYAEPDQFNALLKTRIHLELNEVALGVPTIPEVPEEDEGNEKDEPKSRTDSGTLKIRIIRNADLKPAENAKVSLEAIAEKIRVWERRNYVRIFVASTTSQAERISYLLSQKEIACRVVNQLDWNHEGAVQICEGSLSAGFRIPSEKLAIVTDAEIFGPKKQRAARKSDTPTAETSFASFVPSLEDLHPDEHVVHSHHGIGRYRGLVKLEIDKIIHDFLLIEYAGGDKLYLPVYRLDQVQRYIGAQEGVTLDKLGNTSFEKTKDKVKAALQEMAHHLLQLYAKRASRQGFAFSPADEAYREFEAKFPYAETPDQLKAIEDASADMESGKIMDRLVCGDVGYGKTEVAMRAAFRALNDGKQVAVLVPTTVLALQHERSFRERFKDSPLPANIGVLSRFKSQKEIKEVLAGMKDGKVDIVIGTHRLLSKDVSFKDLGLIIVDEEQRFGVEHKERLKTMRVNTDVLTLTATPIPRTLHMSLMGLRDISVINTPPVDRLSVRTYVARLDEDVIQRAIRQELSRGGQVFFIHNRVQSINAMADRLRSIVPEAKVIVAHGQLDEKKLEEKMLEFYDKKGNVLLCSTIIESGLDVPSANTMIINRADMFGLAQLYQLRGRVGRSQSRAYCYLLLPEEGAVTEDAKKRLEIIQRFVDLGSGFKIASHDLELRGGGDVLGKSQSGHIAAVGFELYAELLDEAIRELKGEAIEDHFDPEIKIPAPALLPESYVPDIQQRLGLYKRFSQAPNVEVLHDLELELQDRYGKPPEEVQNLLWLIRIKQILRKFHIKSLVAGSERTALDASGSKGPSSLPQETLSPAKMLSLVEKDPKQYLLTPDSKIVLRKPFTSAKQLFHDVQKLLDQVAER